jgi:co-chaperonin GroES (HSP10)
MSVNQIEGAIKPLQDKVMVCDMEFGLERTASGLILPSDDGRSSGIHPRWGRVYAIGPKQTEVKPGDWVLIEHGRWSRGVDHLSDTGEKTTIRLIDTDAILLISDEKPADAIRAAPVGAGSNFNFNIPGA